MKKMLIILFCFVTVLTVKQEKSAALSKTEELISAYSLSTNKEKKIEILGKLISGNKDYHSAFYSLFYSLGDDESQIPYFKEALKKYGKGELLIDLNVYLKSLYLPIISDDRVKSLSQNEIELLEKIISEGTRKSAVKFASYFEKEIVLIAEKNYNVLISELKRIFKEEGEYQSVETIGPLLGLLSLQEKGFDLLFASVKTKDEGTLVFILGRETFGHLAVIPVLKRYENPASTKDEKRRAGTLIVSFPDYINQELVIDKIVEAYKHGRYFPIKDIKNDDLKINNLKRILEIAESWWGNLIKGIYKENDFFIKYIAENHLSNPNGQEQIIELIGNTNFKTASPYLECLDFKSLSDKSIETLIFLTSSISSKEENYPDARFSLFCKLFKEMECGRREKKKLLFGLRDFPENKQRDFIISNFISFTEDEKKTAIFFASDLPQEMKNSIYNSIKSNCNPQLLEQIKYLE